MPVRCDQAAIVSSFAKRRRVKEGLHRRLAEAPSPLMRPVLGVTLDPGIEVGLKFGDRSIDLLAEDDAIELIEHRLVEPLNDAISLAGSWSWCARMVDIFERSEIGLVFVMLARLPQYSVPRSVSTRQSLTWLAS